jgi:hypothetical protein
MDLDHVRSEIEHMRVQVGRQRKEILHLQRAGIGTASANFCSGQCWRRSRAFVMSGIGSRRSGTVR